MAQNALHVFEGIINVATDILLVAISIIIIIFPLQMAFKTRLIVIAFYASRLLLGLIPSPPGRIVLTRSSVVVVAILQLTYVPLRLDANFTLRAYPYYLTRQFTQFASITSACIVYFWPFLQSIQSGLLGLHNTSRDPQYPLVRSSGSREFSGEPDASRRSSAGIIEHEYLDLSTDEAASTQKKSHYLA